MNRPNATIIESNIPSADQSEKVKFGEKLSAKRIREQEDITLWLEMQEEAEMELLMQELAGSDHRNYRRFVLH